MKPPKYTQEAINRYRQNRTYKVNCPSVGGSRHSVSVKPGGKPPKLRFKPGMMIELEGQLYEVLYAFRLQDAPHEWRYMLEERKSVDEALDDLGQLMEAMELGKNTPRVFYELFRDSMDAWTYFSDIPRNGDGRVVSNQTLLKGKIISSGKVQ